jgi:hypothetical protein
MGMIMRYLAICTFLLIAAGGYYYIESSARGEGKTASQWISDKWDIVSMKSQSRKNTDDISRLN